MKQNHKLTLTAVLIPVLLLAGTISIWAQFAGGQGTEDDPWQVAEAEHLNNVRTYLGEEHSDKHFLQTADIDLGVAPWDEGEGWEPIGSSREPFYGVYNGGEHRIINMYINRERSPDIGLFGAIAGENAIVKNLGLQDIDITGARPVGGLSAFLTNGATVSKCFVAGTIAGFRNVGGFIGIIDGTEDNMPTVSDCYVSGTVIGEQETGGFLGGGSQGIITNSYSSAEVTGNERLTGGFACLHGDPARISNCFWDIEASGIDVSNGGTGLSTIQMLQQNSFRGWNFRHIWNIVEEETYPYLGWQQEPDEHNYPALGSPSGLTVIPGNNYIDLSWEHPSTGVWTHYNIYKDDDFLTAVNADVTHYRDEDVENYVQYTYYVKAVWEDGTESRPSNVEDAVPHLPFAGGAGTVDDPYQVASAQHLNDMRYQPAQNYLLTANINLDIPPWNEGTGWEPVGYYITGLDAEAFSGSFDGNGFVISGLTINNPTMNYVGLFGYLNGSNITNVTLEEVEINGYYYVGGLASRVVGETTVTNCSVSGNITGWSRVGGLVAYYAEGGEIVNCHTYGHVTGQDVIIGGLIGETTSSAGNVSNSGSNSNITAEDSRIGGLVAVNRTTIIDCFYSGHIEGGTDMGGISGQNYGNIERSYSEGRLVGDVEHYAIGGISGRNFGNISYCYTDVNIILYRFGGGLVGSNGGTGTISNSYARGSITGLEEDIMIGRPLGGIAGETGGDIINCFSTVNLTAPEEDTFIIGGLVGRIILEPEIIDSHWDVEASGQEESAGGEGRTTVQMTYPYDDNTYQNWDFAEIWVDDEDERTNDGYPFLFWQEVIPYLAAPVVTISTISIDGIDHSVLNWEPVEDAISYRIYSSEYPDAENWGEPAAIVADTEFSEVLTHRTRYYKVTASIQEAP